LTVADNSSVEGLGGGEVRVLSGSDGFLDKSSGQPAFIAFIPPASGEVKIRVFTLAGVAVWEGNKQASAGEMNVVRWEGQDDGGQQVSSGVYLVELTGAGMDSRSKIAVME
jgi:flagellar hook assembly protein FlgD